MDIVLDVNKETLANLLCSVIEAGRTYGCGYWGIADKEASEQPPVLKSPDRQNALQECGDFFGEEEIWYVHWPLYDGGSLVFIEHDDGWFDDDGNVTNEVERHTLNLESIQHGISIMATKYPHKFAEVLQDEIDGSLGDLFLQCCFFDEEKYA